MGLRPQWASNGIILIVMCDVTPNVLISSATSEASLYG